MGLDDAIKRVDEQARASEAREAQRFAEEAPKLASIQAELDELSSEILAWLTANPRAQVILARATVGSDSRGQSASYGIVPERRGWRLGSFFLTDGGTLHSFTGLTWFGQYYTPSVDWTALLANEAERLGVAQISPSRSWSQNNHDGPVYGPPALTPMHPVIRQTSTEWTVPSELFRRENGDLMSSGNWEPFADIIAREMLRLTP